MYEFKKIKGILDGTPQFRESRKGDKYFNLKIKEKNGFIHYCKVWEKSLFGLIESLKNGNEIEVHGANESFTSTYDGKERKSFRVTNIISQKENFHLNQQNFEENRPKMSDGFEEKSESFPFVRLKNRLSKISATCTDVRWKVDAIIQYFNVPELKIHQLLGKTLEKNTAQRMKMTGDTSEWNFRKPLFEYSLWEILILSVWHKLMANGEMPVKKFMEAKSLNILKNEHYNKLADYQPRNS